MVLLLFLFIKFKNDKFWMDVCYFFGYMNDNEEFIKVIFLINVL